MNKYNVELLQNAIKRLEKAAKAKARRGRIPLDLAKQVDAVIDLQFSQDCNVKAFVEIKRALRPAHLSELEYLRDQCREREPDTEFLVVTEVISEPLALELRSRQMWFVDLAGNLHIDLAGKILLFVAGFKTAEGRNPHVGWRPSEQAAKLLFQLVREGPDLQMTYRDLVDLTGVSLGIVSKLFTAWREERLIRRAERGAYRVLDAGKLLEYWCDTYAQHLSPRLVLGTYRSQHEDEFERILEEAPAEPPFVVGGEYAADLLTGYLRGTRLHLYVQEEAGSQLQQQLLLARSQTGNIEIRRRFSPNLAANGSGKAPAIAHPALLYAELMAGDHRRLSETAIRLRRKYLTWTL